MAELSNHQQPTDSPTDNPEVTNARVTRPTANDIIQQIPDPVVLYEPKLPDAIPSRWLDDIRNAVKESRKKLIITTVLSSSLLTGVIATLTSYSLENKKTALQLEMEDAKDTLHQYNVLRDDVSDLKYQLVLSASVFQMTADPSVNEAMIQNAGTQVRSLMDRAAAIEKSVAKIDDQETFRLVDDTLRPLIRELDDTPTSLKDQAKQKKLAQLCSSTGNEGVKKILDQIKQKKRELSVF